MRSRSRTRPARAVLGLVLSLLLALTLGAALPSCGSQPRPDPVLVVGVDGFEWDVALPLLREGRMPHLAGLMERGNFGLLETSQPTFSPIIWTTIATGKGPREHGIGGFVKPRRTADEPQRLYGNSDRRTKAIWNMVSESGLRVGVIGWWMTFPAEPVEGVMIAQTNTAEQTVTAGGENIWKGALLRDVPGQVWPPTREPQVWRTFDSVAAGLPELETRIFGSFTTEHTEFARRLWQNCRWAFRADAVYADLARDLLSEPEPPDLTLVYLGGPDVVGHRFWLWRAPELYAYQPPAGEIADLGGVIDDYYTYVDGVLGELLAAAAPNTRVMVLADHGMHPVNQDRMFDADAPTGDVNSGHHLDAPPGIIVVAGAGFRRHTGSLELNSLQRSDLRPVGAVLDIAPTLLTLLGLPVGTDMRGAPTPALLDDDTLASARPLEQGSYDTPQWIAQHAALQQIDPGEAERLEQLRKLGYVGEE